MQKRTMTLNLTDEEMDILDQLSSRDEISKTSIIRKALRMYYFIDERIQKGERIYVEDIAAKKTSELVVL